MVDLILLSLLICNKIVINVKGEEEGNKPNLFGLPDSLMKNASKNLPAIVHRFEINKYDT